MGCRAEVRGLGGRAAAYTSRGPGGQGVGLPPRGGGPARGRRSRRPWRPGRPGCTGCRGSRGGVAGSQRAGRAWRGSMIPRRHPRAKGVCRGPLAHPGRRGPQAAPGGVVGPLGLVWGPPGAWGRRWGPWAPRRGAPWSGPGVPRPCCRRRIVLGPVVSRARGISGPRIPRGACPYTPGDLLISSRSPGAWFPRYTRVRRPRWVPMAYGTHPQVFNSWPCGPPGGSCGGSAACPGPPSLPKAHGGPGDQGVWGIVRETPR